MQRTVWRGFGDGSVTYDPGMLDALLAAQSGAQPGAPVQVMPDPLATLKQDLADLNIPVVPIALGAVALGLVLALLPSPRRSRR
jgi:hypothetical protein